MKGGYRGYGETEHAYLFSGAMREGAPLPGMNVSASLTHDAFLAADVGGTYARIGLIAFRSNEHAPTVVAYRVYKCADHADLQSILRAFCDELSVKPNRLVLACAGFLHDGVIVNNNLRWQVAPAHLAKNLGFKSVNVLNDFEALAYGTSYLDASNVKTLHRPDNIEEARGPIVIVGPGTGLGVAVRFPDARPAVLATEAGHIQLAARTGREQQVLSELAPANSHVPYDEVLSGPGLLRLYRALCRLERMPVMFQEPAAITAAACTGSNVRAVEALQMFCGWLGSYVGDLAMLYGATGGIYIAGGFLSQIGDFVEKSSFVSRFLDKGVVRPFLQTVPVHVVEHAQLGVIGAACWMKDRCMRDPNA
jgi:glucokinase